ncbi:hypothetical protein [Vulgatibacter sp.]|uniref:hypothetical protein n=1 Tax=Vulgatibacter sp. TaxID=1971226 RepID=UPI00356A69BD
MKKRKPKYLDLSTHQANVIACAALRNLLASLESVEEAPERKDILAMLDRAITDGRPGASQLALGLVLAGTGAWEATVLAEGRPSILAQYEQIKAETGGGRCDA